MLHSQNASSKPTPVLAEALVGVWALRQFSEREAGVTATYPFGITPEGLLVYTPTGFVSAVLMAPDRPHLSGSGFAEGTADEYKAAGRGFIGYSGTYEVDEVRSVVTHHPTVAFAPNMVRQPQERHIELDDDVLVLTAKHPPVEGNPPTESRLK